MIEQLRPCDVCFIAQLAGQSGVTLFEAANQMVADVEQKDSSVAHPLRAEVTTINRIDCVGGVCPRITAFNEALRRTGAYSMLQTMEETGEPPPSE